MNRQEVEQIIQKMKSLDLSRYPQSEIISLFREVGQIPILITTLHPGHKIIRGRINNGDDFSSISSHSYCPSVKNDEYQRASIPHETMFYGSVTSPEEEEPVARISILTEISKIFTEGVDTEKIMYSAWEVIGDLQLVSIIQSGLYRTPNKQIMELDRRFNEEYNSEVGKVFFDFIASEFAKDNTPKDYDYMISALFSHIISNNGLDGVYYPSVRIDGAGMNVAISPRAVDTKMKFLGAVDCEVTRIEKNVDIIEKYKSIISTFKLEYIPITEADYKTLL